MISPHHRSDSHGRRAFTLLELLVVITILSVLLVLLVPAFTSRKNSDDVTNAAFDVSSALENARTFAIANNTYVWVGFFEEDAGTSSGSNPRPAGIGRVVISVAAARHGNRYKDSIVNASEPHAFYPPPPSPTPIPGSDSNPVILTQIGRVMKIQNSHLAVLPETNIPRPEVPIEYQVGAEEFAFHPPGFGSGAVLNPTTFNYPLSADPADVEYTFTKIIEFNSRGEASKIVDLPTQLIEIGLQPTRGNVADTGTPNPVAIQVSGATGRTKMYRR